MSLSVATLVPMATLMHRKSRLGNFPWIGIPWRVLQALSSPRPDGRQTDDMLPKIISLDSIDMLIDMCVDMYIDMCIDMQIDMCVDMCVDMCADMCVDMCIGMCIDIV